MKNAFNLGFLQYNGLINLLDISRKINFTWNLIVKYFVIISSQRLHISRLLFKKLLMTILSIFKNIHYHRFGILIKQGYL